MILHFKPLPHFKRDIKAIQKKHLPIKNIKLAVHFIITENRNELHLRKDHHLNGNLQGYRELHVKGFNDLILLYKITDPDNPNKELLKLVRIGKHKQLFK